MLRGLRSARCFERALGEIQFARRVSDRVDRGSGRGHQLCKQGVTGSIAVPSTNFFLIAKDLEKSPRHERSFIRAHCVRMRHWSASVHNGAAENSSPSPTDAISFTRRLSFSSASRFVHNFIWEYFLKTCAPLWRSSCVTHSSATPLALGRAKCLAERAAPIARKYEHHHPHAKDSTTDVPLARDE
jgi:hypothetical protein